MTFLYQAFRRLRGAALVLVALAPACGGDPSEMADRTVEDGGSVGEGDVDPEATADGGSAGDAEASPDGAQPDSDAGIDGAATPADAQVGPIDCGAGVFEGNLAIVSSADLGKLSGVSHVKGDLTVTNAPIARDLQVRCVDGMLRIAALGAAADLAGLRGLQVVGSLKVENNTQLADLSMLSGLRSVATDVLIENNPQLTSLGGLSSLVRVEGRFDIWRNAKLTSLVGLEQLGHVGGRLWIANQPLTDLSGLSGLGHLGGLRLIAVTNLSSMRGMSALTELAGSIYLDSLPTITSLLGLERITSVSESFMLDSCPALTTLQGFALRSIGKSLSLGTAPVLTDISALLGLERVGSDVSIYENSSLPQCRVDAVMAHFAQRGFTGPTFIENNLGTGTCAP